MTVNLNETLFNRAKATIPGGVNSPVRAFNAVGGPPRFVKRAQGAYFCDANAPPYLPSTPFSATTLLSGPRGFRDTAHQ